MQKHRASIWLFFTALGAAALFNCAKGDSGDVEGDDWGTSAVEAGGSCGSGSGAPTCDPGLSCLNGTCEPVEPIDTTIPSPTPNPSPAGSYTTAQQGLLSAHRYYDKLVDGYTQSANGPVKLFRAIIKVKDMTLDDFLQYGLMAVTHVRIIKHPDNASPSARQEWNFYIPYNWAMQAMDITGLADVQLQVWLTSQDARAAFNERRLDPSWPGASMPDSDVSSLGCGGNRIKNVIPLPGSAFALAANDGDCAPFGFDAAFQGSTGNTSFSCKRSRKLNVTSDNTLVAMCAANTTCTPPEGVACRPPLPGVVGSTPLQINCWAQKWGNPQNVAAKAVYNRIACSASSAYNHAPTNMACTTNSQCGTDAVTGVQKLCLPGVNGNFCEDQYEGKAQSTSTVRTKAFGVSQVSDFGIVRNWPITAASRVGTTSTAEFTTSAPHGLMTDRMVRISNIGGSGWPNNKIFTVTEIVSATKFRVNLGQVPTAANATINPVVNGVPSASNTRFEALRVLTSDNVFMGPNGQFTAFTTNGVECHTGVDGAGDAYLAACVCPESGC